MPTDVPGHDESTCGICRSASSSTRRYEHVHGSVTVTSIDRNARTVTFDPAPTLLEADADDRDAYEFRMNSYARMHIDSPSQLLGVDRTLSPERLSGQRVTTATLEASAATLREWYPPSGPMEEVYSANRMLDAVERTGQIRGRRALVDLWDSTCEAAYAAGIRDTYAAQGQSVSFRAPDGMPMSTHTIPYSTPPSRVAHEESRILREIDGR